MPGLTTLDEEAFWGMDPNRTYASRAFPESEGVETTRMLRYVSKVIDAEVVDRCEVVAGETVIRQTPGGRQQIKALIYEDDRSIKTLTIQRFFDGGIAPSSRQYFSFKGVEIDRILRLLQVTRGAVFDCSDKARFADYLDGILSQDAALSRLLHRYRERIAQLEDNGSLAQYLEFCERKNQLEMFERLLYDDGFIDHIAAEWDKRGVEAVWQDFFERNPWIFGLSLSPVFLSSLDSKKLEQVVEGYSVAGEGKRVDALMRTNGILGSLCFVEIKTHRTPLLHPSAYRTGAWGVSSDVAGAVAQCHTSIQDAMNRIRTKLLPQDKDGNPSGEEYYLYQPRSYLVVGCLDQFVTQHGANESKFRSFELYRRHTHSPEIVTFDELLERARAIVDCSPSKPK
jgi:hypothetical protein